MFVHNYLIIHSIFRILYKYDKSILNETRLTKHDFLNHAKIINGVSDTSDLNQYLLHKLRNIANTLQTLFFCLLNFYL